MGALAVVVADTIRNLRAGVIEAEEQGSLSSSSRIRPLKLSQKPFCVGFTGAMKCRATWLSSDEVSMALQVNSVPWRKSSGAGHDQRTPRIQNETLKGLSVSGFNNSSSFFRVGPLLRFSLTPVRPGSLQSNVVRLIHCRSSSL